jgi:tetratricopeptide (TPR) repeat protein
MRTRLAAPLRDAPAAVPALGALALTAVWATDQAGYPLTHWAPGGLIVTALLGIALLAAGRSAGGRLRLSEIPPAVRVAAGCLAAYTALSFLSILWAGVPGDAWEGADRTLLYLLVFALFACLPQRGTAAALLVCAWTFALIALAIFALLHVDAAAGSAARLKALLPDGRLVYPAGYVNANAAQWLTAFWPALLLARERRLPWGVRGGLAAGAVVLAETALMSQSRGSVYATAATAVLVFALIPGRVRTFALGVPVAAGIAAAAGAVLRAGDRVSALESVAASGAAAHGATAATARNAAAAHGAASAFHGAAAAILLGALAVGTVVAAGAAVESKRGFSPRMTKRMHRSLAAVAAVLLLGTITAGWAAAGDPVARARHAWDTFESPKGYGADSSTGSRLTSGLGSNRYDFYRVALDEFAAHPIGGIGADNFAEQYLRHGRSEESPKYPHSVEMRTLADTGIVGALLALVGLGAALTACRRAIVRSRDPLARAAAAAAVAGFGYWAVHGSVDWLWEFAGLGAPAFALLGIGCALAPRRAVAAGTAPPAVPAPPSPMPPSPSSAAPIAPPPTRTPRSRRARACTATTAAVAAAAAVAAFTAPWLSRLQVESAARVWAEAPRRAYRLLDDAASLNPLSDEPYVVAGSIALRLGEPARADREFALALGRTPGDVYATLERGAIASAQGRPSEARVLLERAARLDPRDRLIGAVLVEVQAGRRVDVAELNRSILRSARQFS